MTGTTIALAIFVKTPGHSPLKTRLAHSIGPAAAEEFHRRAVAAVAAVARGASQRSFLHPVWAVAEEQALDDPLWDDFEQIWQGDGGLGERLRTVYDRLLARHRGVLLIGADSPQLTVEMLCEAASRLANDQRLPFVMGRARDGGFWLFGGRDPIPAGVWTGVSYSQPHTADQLLRLLRAAADVDDTLPRLTDVDTHLDLPRLADELSDRADATPEQRRLLAWIHSLPDLAQGNAPV